MTWLVALTVITPLASAAVGLAIRERHRLRDTITLLGLGAAAAASLVMLWLVARDGTHVVQVGGWSPELGIVLVADLFAALVLPVALSIIFVVEIFAIGRRHSGWGADPYLAGPLLGVLTSGVALAILTGDLFTLFVSFELILVSSYVLLTHQGRHDQVRSGMTYVVMNLMASTLFPVRARPRLRRNRHREHGVALPADPRAEQRCPAWHRGVVPRGLRHQGGGVPAVLVAT